MTDLQFQKWMSLNFDFKKAAFKAMNQKDQMDCLKKASALDGGERLCYHCSSWRIASDDYGTCENPNSPFYQKSTNCADGCILDKDADEAMMAINEAIRENIQYSSPN